MISVQNVFKNFAHHQVLKNINIQVKTGEIVGILGPNGAGKTTTMRIITGVLPPTKGQVEINGLNLDEHELELKQKIGYLPENNPLPNEPTVEEFLIFWARIKGIKESDTSDALDQVVRSTGIQEVFYRPISELSKGYKQRVGLSQSLLTKPDYLILDEPTEGLDPNQRQEIASLIRKLGKKRTVIISSHVLSEIGKICNRIIIIHKGVIVADNTPTKLRKIKSSSQIINVEIKGTKVLSGLKKITGVINVQETQANHYAVETSEADVREQIFKAAVKNKWILLSMIQKEVGLEEVFSQLTK